jgi:glycosyltransferase involved in cell wall biosynthesis
MIIVESGSTDGTSELLQQIADKSPFPVKVIHKPKANIAQGRNLAIQEAQYDLIACIDFGCEADPKWLENLVTPFEMNPDLLVSCGWYEPINKDGKPVRHRKWWPRLEQINPQSFIPSSRSLAFRKKAWQAVGGYPEWLTLTGEDTYFALELKKYGGTWAFVPEASVRWEAPDSVIAYLSKIYHWSIGDGESSVFALYYWRYFLALSALFFFGSGTAVSLILGIFYGFPFWLISALGVAGLTILLPIVNQWTKAGIDPIAWLARAFAVAGFLKGRQNRKRVDERRIKNIKGIWFILSGVPIDDTGGGARATQITLELLQQGYYVVFISKFPKYESKELHIRITHPNLQTYSMENFHWNKWEKVNRLLLDSGKPLATLVEFPLNDFLPLIEQIKKRKGSIIYDLIDDWNTSLGSTWYRKETEQEIIDKADHLVATASFLAERLQNLSGRSVLLLPNAVNTRLFVPNRPYKRPPDFPRGKWSMIYIGALWGNWFDWDLLIRLSDRYPEAKIVVIGDYRGQCPEKRSNLHFLGLKPQRELPPYLAYSDVAIIPWKVNEVTLSTSPLKVYEYLAMKLPVVAPDLPPLRGIPGVWLASNPNEFIELTSQVRWSSYPTLEVEKFVAENSWIERVKSLTKLLEGKIPVEKMESVS